jgi:hypothetical protein
LEANVTGIWGWACVDIYPAQKLTLTLYAGAVVLGAVQTNSGNPREDAISTCGTSGAGFAFPWSSVTATASFKNVRFRKSTARIVSVLISDGASLLVSAFSGGGGDGRRRRLRI